MALIRNGLVSEAEERYVCDGDELPADGRVVISGVRWLGQEPLHRARGNVGIRLAPDFEVEALEGRLDGVTIIEVEFPSFTDGRGYTVGRLLRERLGYEGELRAVGDVLPDQLRYMARCGFDSFALKPDKRIVTALATLGHLRVTYQPAVDTSEAHWRR